MIFLSSQMNHEHDALPQCRLAQIDLSLLFFHIFQSWMGASDATNPTGIHESDLSDGTNNARYIERRLPDAIMVRPQDT